MKVGILTFHRAINYGAVWQSYALMTYLRNKNVSAEIIDYYPSFLEYSHKHIPKRPWKGLSRIISIVKFNKFVRENLKLSRKQYKDSISLNKLNSEYDIFITGSDTVWNLSIVKSDISTFLLDFVDKTKVKASYAASMGGQDATLGNENLFENSLVGYKSISMRESLFIPRLQKITNRTDITEVLDPTFLLTKQQYNENFNFSKCEDNNYIVLLNLSGESGLDQFARNLSKIKNMTLVNISGSFKSYMKNPIGLSPVKWLEKIFNSNYVCTDSFHGLCFSLIFEKQFYCIGASTGFRSFNNVRVENLLKNVDLYDRFVLSRTINYSNEIDYNQVNKKLEVLRNKSYKYIETVIS